MTLHDVALDDKYDLSKERIFLSGAQAVIRMLLMQRERDRRAGLDTAGFVSGYRGSPLGGLDMQFVEGEGAARRRPISSSSPASTRSSPRPPAGAPSRPNCWAKASTTASSASGTARGRASTARATCSAMPISPARRKHGGVLALMGDDHTAESSTNAHATEYAVRRHDDADPQPGRRPGDASTTASTAMRCRASPAPGRRSNASRTTSNRRPPSTPRSTGSNIVMPRIRHAAGRAQHPPRDRPCSARKSGCTSTSAPPPPPSSAPTGSTASSIRAAASPKLGIITVGKSYLDVRQALDDLGIDEARANRHRHAAVQGRLPMAARPRPHRANSPAASKLIVVVEEKRSLIEVQVREGLYGTAIAAGGRRQEGRARRLAVSGQGRARPQRDRHRARRADL